MMSLALVRTKARISESADGVTGHTYQLNPQLLVYVDEVNGSSGVLMDIDAKRPPLVVDDARLPWALSTLPPQFCRNEAIGTWSSNDSCLPVVDALWNYCVSANLIVPADHESRQLHAGYHGATRSYPFLNMARSGSREHDNARMQTYIQSDPYPPVYMSVPTSERIALPKVEAISSTTSGSLIEELAMLFDGVFGERDHIGPYWDPSRNYLQVELIFKSIPSGGARHPTECFAFFDLVETGGTLLAGTYHYNVSGNSLDKLQPQRPMEALIIPAEQAGSAFAGAIGSRMAVILASNVERAMWRYRDPRSFRAVVVDVGHAVQQLAEIAGALGWHYEQLDGFDAEALARALGLDDAAMPILGVGLVSR